MKKINYKDLSDWGLIYKINKEVLHPLGISLSWDPDTGSSDCLLVADDMIWRYADELAERNEEKLKKFLENRVNILRNVKEEDEII